MGEGMTNNAANQQLPVTPPRPTQHSQNQLSLVRLPRKLQIPKKMTLLATWQAWFCGSPAFRTLLSRDFEGLHVIQRFNDMKYVMDKIQAHVPGFPASPYPTLEEANEAFSCAMEEFELLRHTPTGRTRRVDQIRWYQRLLCFVLRARLQTLVDVRV